MAVPPLLIRIKRKATDEPVDLLRVHEEPTGKRQRRTIDFVFQRQPGQKSREEQRLSAPDQREDSAAETRVGPRVRTSKPGDELRDPYLQALGHVPMPTSPAAAKTVETRSLRASSPHPLSRKSSSSSVKKLAPRRFHMSKSNLAEANSGLQQKRRAQVALFMERSTRADITNVTQTAGPAKKRAPLAAEEKLAPSVTPSGPAKEEIAFPKASFGEGSEELAAALEQFTLQEIAKNLAEAAPTSPASTPRPAARKLPSRFRPKLPPPRVRQRGLLEDVPAPTPEVHERGGTPADDEYVYETYVRIPASTVALDEGSYGILVLEDNDFQYFYQDEDSDDDDGIYDEEEDENAENHPSHDYPDDELASDDEFDMNPYQYRVYRSDDDDDFPDDEGFVATSDEEDADDRPPWRRNPAAWGRSAAGTNEFRSYYNPTEL